MPSILTVTPVRDQVITILINSASKIQVLSQHQPTKCHTVSTLCIRLQYKDHAPSISNLKRKARCVVEMHFLFMDVPAALLVMTLTLQLLDAQLDVLY